MEKKESIKGQDIKNPTFTNKKSKESKNLINKKDKALPWWVEFLFVQIGLPDKWLSRILRGKKKSREFIKTEKKLIFIFIFIFAFLAYIYPVVKYSKTKLDCEANAKNYIRENKNLNKSDLKKLKMLSTNFCNGGEEIYEIENVQD